MVSYSRLLLPLSKIQIPIPIPFLATNKSQPPNNPYAYATTTIKIIMVAGTTHHLIGIHLSRNTTTRTFTPLRISSTKNGLSIPSDKDHPTPASPQQGPSCIFVGPIETATQENLEAFYRQARDAYYSGKPLVVDDIFDRVELQLRWYNSKYVVKYPRCSLRQQSTYADAQEDPSQVLALASVWLLFLGIGSSACLVPVLYIFGQVFEDTLDSGFSPLNSHAPVLELIAMLNGMLVMMLGSMIGYPIASASVRALQGLWKNDLVALKGACPNCSEEVFAFVKSNEFNNSPHKAECHVCECLLEFRTKVERSAARPGKRWVYGRIYLIRRRRMNRGQR